MSFIYTGELSVTHSIAEWQPKRRKCFFMHIPKTSGMTLRSILKSQYHIDKVLDIPSEISHSELSDISDNIDLFIGHITFGARSLLPKNVFTFTFLRDPAARTISSLRHLRDDAGFHSLHSYARGKDLRSLLEDPIIRPHCQNIQTKYLSSPSHKGNVEGVRPDLDLAIRNANQLDFVGFTACFDTDICNLLYNMGLHPQETYPRINSAAQRESPEYFSPELIELARDLNREDELLYEHVKQRRIKACIPKTEQWLNELIVSGVYPTIREATNIPISGPVPGQNIWPAENYGTVFRWTGPGYQFTLQLPLDPAQDFLLKINVHSIADAGSLTTQVDGLATPMRLEEPSEGGATVCITLRSISRMPRYREVGISCSNLRVASQSDRRLVGFVISSIKVFPLSKSENIF